MSSPKVLNTEIDPVKHERAGIVREVGSQAIWSLSTCKPGFKSKFWCYCKYLFVFI